MKKDAKNYSHPRKTSNYFTTGNLLPIVEKILSKRNSFLALAKKYKTPFYAYDREELDENIERFMKAFQSHIPRFQAYYAMKLNHHHLIASNGYGEILGTAEKISDLQMLDERMRDKGKDGDARYEFVRDIHQVGCVPHSAFGMGVERLIRWLINIPHVRDAIPFPRTFKRRVAP